MLQSASVNDGLAMRLHEVRDGQLVLLAQNNPAQVTLGPDRADAPVDPNQQPNNTQDDAYEITQIENVGRIIGLSIHEGNDEDWFRFRLSNSPARLLGTAAVPVNGALSGSASFSLAIGGAAPVAVTVPAIASNTTLGQLVSDINAALSTALLSGDIIAHAVEGRVSLSLLNTNSPETLTISGLNAVATNELKLVAGTASPQTRGSIGMIANEVGSGLSMRLVNADGGDVFLNGVKVQAVVQGQLNTIDLTGLAEDDYWLKVESASSLTGTYDLLPAVSDTGNNTLLDLSGPGASALNLSGLNLQPSVNYLLQVTSPNVVPTIYDLTFAIDANEPITVNLAQRTDAVRHDVILGGPGNDVLMGGPGEDWIFGGDGEDQVLFLGGDYDRLGRPVPDHVAIRWNRFLHRYEFTSLVWDIANQEFVAAEQSLGATLVSAAEVSAFDLGGNLNVTITIIRLLPDQQR